MSLLEPILWSLAPISELRGGIPIGVLNGHSIFIAFLIAVVANWFVIPILFFFLDNLHHVFMKWGLYNRLFTRYIEGKRHKLEKHVGTKWEFVMLMLFVGIPLPITGAYTGTLLAWFFDIPRKKAYLALTLGILLAGIIVSLVVGLSIGTLDFFLR